MERLIKPFLVLIIGTLHLSIVYASGNSSGDGGGGPKVTPNANRQQIIIDGLNGGFNIPDTLWTSNSDYISTDTVWTFNPDKVKNIQMNDGVIIGMGQLINPVREDVMVDMSSYNQLYQMGVDNIEMNSGEIILVEPQGFYIAE